MAMTKSSSANGEALVRELQRSRVLAILRGLPPSLVVKAVEAMRSAGVRLFEVTSDSPDWQQSLASVRVMLAESGCRLGAGTILEVRQAEDAVKCGATFLVAPVLRKKVADYAGQAAVAYLPGAMSPNEVFEAHEQGATAIKVFPADTLGPKYISRLLQPMPFLRLLPTGGITIATAADYIRAGAIGVALGSELVEGDSLRTGHPGPTTERATALMQSLSINKQRR